MNTKPPPFLLGATLLFWGWQAGYLVPAAVMALLVELPRWLHLRWEVSDEDFTRTWTFCSLLLLALTVYAFTSTEATSEFSRLLQNPSLRNQRNAGVASARAVGSLIRWLPMIFLPFLAAQLFSTREGIPMQTISLILRARWRKAKKEGLPPPPTRTVNVGYPYFALCLFSASIHTSEGATFFWGLAGLVAWALWEQRSRRFGLAVWVATLGAAIGLGFWTQHSINQLQRYLGNINPSWLTGWTARGFDPTRSRTMIGQIGRIKTSKQIVVRLEPRADSPAPALLREASYRTYKAQVWYSPSTRRDFEQVSGTTNSYPLLPGKPTPAAVNIACYLPGGRALIPLPEGTATLDNLAAYVVHKNNLGAVLVEGPGLVIFDAQFGPGETIDSPPEPDDLAGPPQKEIPALQEVIADLNLEGQSLDHAMRALRGYFLEKFEYRTWQEPSSLVWTNETPLTRFLLRTHAGHCEYFATAATLILRQLGFPTRYAVGYAVHEASGQRKYVVRQRDAHAWCLAWDDSKKIWRSFDATPGSWVQAEDDGRSLWRAIADFWSRLTFEISKVRWGQSHLREYILIGLVPVLGLLLYQLIFRRRKRAARKPAKGLAHRQDWPGLDSEFYAIERALHRRGLTREPGETLTTLLRRAARELGLNGAGAALQDLLRLHYRYRFDPAGLDEAEREALRRGARDCLARLEGAGG
jgi:transglutaminase-like putative cysteine protease